MQSSVNVGWIVRHDDSFLESQLPSLRLRLGAAKTCSNLTIKTGARLTPEMADIFVISKNTYISLGDEAVLDKTLELCRQIKSKSKTVLVDYTDHYLYDLEHHENLSIDPFVLSQYVKTSQFYKDLINIADGVIVSSPGLHKAVKSFTRKPVFFLADAIDAVPSNFQDPASIEISGLWYGMHSTFKLFLSSLPKLSSSLDKKTKIRCLVQDFTYKKLKANQIEVPKTKNIILEAEIWSFDKMISRAQDAHFIVIPSNVQDFRKSLASSNRLLTAFSMRRPVWATPIDSYREFDDYYYSLDRTSFNLTAELKKHSKTQTDLAFEVALKYSTQSMGKKWHELFVSVMETKP
jgi:hypothetical protein